MMLSTTPSNQRPPPWSTSIEVEVRCGKWMERRAGGRRTGDRGEIMALAELWRETTSIAPNSKASQNEKAEIIQK
jgi:hypothetical protein